MSDLSQFQDVFGQLPFFKCYTQLCIGFHIDNSQEEEVIAEIKKAVTKLTDTFPWLAGHVINEGSGPGNSGLFRIVQYEKQRKDPPVAVKRVPEIDFEELARKKAPSSMLDGSILAPRNGVPVPYEDDEPAEVFSLQANFVKGGLILTFSGNHIAIDMNGQGHLISLFAKVMRGERLSETEIKEGNRDRREIIPLLKDNEPLLDHSMMQVDPTAGPPPELHPARWVYYRFSEAALEKLKQEALLSVRNGFRLSTNDVLAAFFWQRVSVARQARLPSDERTHLGRAVNGRRILDPPLSPAYMGVVVTATFTSKTLKEMAKEPLGEIAIALRRDLSDITSYAVRSLTTLISRTPDKSSITYGARLSLSTDMLLSSWAHQETQSLEFGVLGKPAFVRRQRFAPMESLNYIMPKTRDGDIDIAACLREDDIAVLAKDGKWTAYAEYIG